MIRMKITHASLLDVKQINDEIVAFMKMVIVYEDVM